MSDTTLNYFLASGTAAEMAAFTPAPPSPANAPPNSGYLFFQTDTNDLFAWDAVAVAWVQVGGAGTVSVAISAGTQSGNTGTIIFSNSNGVTFGMSNNSVITASVVAGGGGSLNVSAGTTSNNLTAITFSNGSGVSFGLNGSVITASVAGAGVGSVNFSAGTTSNNLTAITFSNANGVSFGLNGSTLTATVQTNYLTTAMASNRGSDFVQATAAFAGTNASGTINSTGISVSVAPPSAGSVNFSAGTTSGNLTAVKFADSNGVSFGLNAGTITATVKTDYQTSGNYLTTADLSQNSSKYVQNWKLTGNTAGTTSSAQGTDLWFSGGNSITVSGSSNSIVFSVGNYLTTAMQSNAATISNINISGGTTSSNLSAFKLIDSNGVSWSLDTGSKIYATVKTDYLTTADLSANSSKYVQNWKLTGNTAGTTSSAQGTDLWFSGGQLITVSGSSNTIVISASSYSTVGTATTVYDVASASSNGTVTRWAAEDHRHAGIGAIGISTAGNSSGTSGSKQGTYWLQGGSNITISQITSNNGSHTAIISANPVGYVNWLEPYPLETATQTLLPAAGSFYFAPVTVFGSMSGGRWNFLNVNTGTANLFQDIGETAYASSKTGGIQQSYTFSGVAALYSQGTGANSTRLESCWSNSHSWGWSKSLSISTNAATNIAVSLAMSLSYLSDIGSDGGTTGVQLAAAGSSTFGNSSAASTTLSTIFSSGRNLISGSLVHPIGFNSTITAGIYWLGYAWSTTRATAITGAALASGPDFGFSALLGNSRLEVNSVYRAFGSTVSAPRSALIPYGVYTGAANLVPPANMAISSDLSSLASQWVPYVNYQVRGLTK